MADSAMTSDVYARASDVLGADGHAFADAGFMKAVFTRAGLAIVDTTAAADMGEIEHALDEFQDAIGQTISDWLNTYTTKDCIIYDDARVKAARTAIRTAIAAAEARALERAATYAERYQRDASFDDSIVGAQQHNANQANIAAGIRALNKAGTP